MKSIIEMASDIMGRNFLGVDQMRNLTLKHPTSQTLHDLEQIPFPMDQLVELKERCILWADPGVSINDIFGLYTKFFLDQIGFDKQPFAMWHRKPCWRLMHKEPIEGSNSLPLAEQLKLLKKGQRLPKAGAYTALAFGYRNKTGRILCPGIMAWCSEQYKPGQGIVAGSSSDKSIDFKIYPWPKNEPDRLNWIVAEETPLRG